MKRISLLALAFAWVLIVASFGTALAKWGGEDYWDVDPSVSSQSRAENSNQYATETGPAPGAFESEGSLETGSLPANPENAIESSGMSTQFHVEEIGGRLDRSGIDDGP